MNKKDCTMYAEIVCFVDRQADKSKDKISAALKAEFNVSESDLEFLLRIGILCEYRGVDENYNGIDFIRTGQRAKLLFWNFEPSRSIDRLNVAKSLANIYADIDKHKP